jgi:hypothetical protein
VTAALLLALWAAGATPAPVPPPDLGVRLEISGEIDLPAVAPAGDRAAVRRLLAQVQGQRPVSSDDVAAIESLVSRYSRERSLVLLREAVLLDAANQASRDRRFFEAADHLRRLIALHPTHVAAPIGLVNLFTKQADWPAAESAARAALDIEPDSAIATCGLAYALLRQDYAEEAQRVLEAFLVRKDDAETRRLLRRIEEALAQEKGLERQRIPHFTVRYDGETHEPVVQHLLQILEEQYAALLARFAHQPLQPIPVFLLTRERYYDGSNPEWSGGSFSTHDGRIRVPISGLSAEGVKKLESTLMHELAHAFTYDMAGTANVPPLLREGIAQVAQGRTLDYFRRNVPTRDGAKVYESYRDALEFTLHLMDLGGQPMLNAALGETRASGDLEKAFEQIYGRSYTELTKAWQRTAARGKAQP